jgi:hypothetical protein
MKLKSPWIDQRTGKKETVYNVDEEHDVVFKYGKYRIFRQWQGSYLYAFGDLVFNCLAGKNENHLIVVAERKGAGFLYDRALENLLAHKK